MTIALIFDDSARADNTGVYCKCARAAMDGQRIAWLGKGMNGAGVVS